MELMTLGWSCCARSRPSDSGVGVSIAGAIGPGSAPARIIDEDGVRTPVEADAAASPTPGSEESADAHSEAEADGAANEESGARRQEHDGRIIEGHHHECRI